MTSRALIDLILDFQVARKRAAELETARTECDRASNALVALLESHGLREAYHAGLVYSIEWRGPGQAEICTRPLPWLVSLADDSANKAESFANELAEAIQ